MTKKTKAKRSSKMSGAAKVPKAAVEAAKPEPKPEKAPKADPKPEKAPRGEPKPEKAPRPGKKVKPVSAVATIRSVLAANPNASAEAIVKVLDQAGLSKPLGTVLTIRSDFLGTYRALTAAGALKRPIALN